MENTKPTTTTEPPKVTSKRTKPNGLLFGLIGVLLVAGVGVALYALGLLPFGKQAQKTASPKNTTEVNALSIYHWWTSPGEAAAINKLIGVFTTKYPDVAIIPAPVSGGGGFQMFPLISSLVKAEQAPDAFQTHPGYEARAYYDANLLESVDSVWQSEGLTTTVPQEIQKLYQYDGHFYFIPVGIHRDNVIWYNKKVLDTNGIDPTTITSWEAFFTATDKLRASGMQHPIQQGEAWTLSMNLENYLVTEGVDVYTDWLNGRITNPEDPKLLNVLTTFKKYLSYTNADRATTGWDTAVKRVIKGDSAFTLMGDWANGEFKLSGMKYGKDYGVLTIPVGTGADAKDVFMLSLDVFTRPKGINHPTNADKWLKVVASKEGQDTFNPLKGSVSARGDLDTTKYDPYQQKSIADLKKLASYPGFGTALPASVRNELNTILATFSSDLNVSKAAGAITAFTKQNIADFALSWSF